MHSIFGVVHLLWGRWCYTGLFATTLFSATQRCNLRCNVGTTLQTFITMSCYDVPMLCCTKIVFENSCVCNIVLTRCLFTHSMVWLPSFGHQDADTQQLLIIYSMLVQILTPLTRWEKPTDYQSRIMRDWVSCLRTKLRSKHQGQLPTPDS